MKCEKCGHEELELLEGEHELEIEKEINGIPQKFNVLVDNVYKCPECDWYTPVKENKWVKKRMQDLVAAREESIGIKEELQAWADAKGYVSPSATKAQLKPEKDQDGTYFSFPKQEGRKAVRFEENFPGNWVAEIYLGEGSVQGYGESPKEAAETALNNMGQWLMGVVKSVHPQSNEVPVDSKQNVDTEQQVEELMKRILKIQKAIDIQPPDIKDKLAGIYPNEDLDQILANLKSADYDPSLKWWIVRAHGNLDWIIHEFKEITGLHEIKL